jgi:S1-C subfamily serine protease
MTRLPSGRRPAIRGFAFAAAAIFATLPGPVAAQPNAQAMQSVVRITCVLPAMATRGSAGSSVMHATGFAWPDATQIVTALHAVAGCQSITVFSEATGATSPASLANVILEADIALLRLARPLGIQPAHPATSPPNLSDSFTIVGYPWGVDVAKGDPLTFSSGMKGALTTLDQAYGNMPELREMFDSREQAYPMRSATILRVGSTLQPGHSGAPIFDSKGQVVAIADGGLFKGFAGMNWSMPVAVYLPRLISSQDVKPTKPSVWALRFSATAVAPGRSVAVPAAAVARGESAAGEFRRVRRVPMAMLAERLRRENNGEPDQNMQFILGELGQQAFNSLAFDIYEDPLTGATVGVPAQSTLVWNPQIRALEARSPDGGARMIIGVIPGRSHADAKATSRQAFLNKLLPLARWQKSPATLAYCHLDPETEWANCANFFDGTDAVSRQPMSLMFSMSVRGPSFLGFAVYAPKEGLSSRDLVTELMMYMAGNNLSEFARR